jgi:hypothetical protein
MPVDVLPVPALPLITAVPPLALPAAPALPPPAPPAPPPPPPPWAKALSGKTITATSAAVAIDLLDIGHSPVELFLLNWEKRDRFLWNEAAAMHSNRELPLRGVRKRYEIAMELTGIGIERIRIATEFGNNERRPLSH